ncbi:N-acetyltransferase [Microlunatus endophyticus]|uniref:N-acetyltransferase n=1 Tax=Microlunatus endophyticus TaxID=1716077 RepID=A0A917VZ22_9ACTN|nr:GNAT family N-acetyltransferase [Microlunatus endophyticus]GGL47003.1 N-acetyltransferase [Microlunatus endophyticus]
MRPEPALRTASFADAEQLFGMARLLATSATPRREAFTQVLADILDDPNRYLIVAETDSGLVGYLYGLTHPAFHANGNIGWVEELYVDPGQRGTGLGRRLMERFEECARHTADARYVAVATRRADDFYRAIGYAESATYYKKDLR